MSDGRAHSKLGASSYSRWGACPGSVRLEADLPEETSVYAEEGTLAHDIASRLLLAEEPEEAYSIARDTEPEMLEAIEVYLEHAKAVRDACPDFFLVEKRVDLSAIYPGLFGTADLMGYDVDRKTLYVSDYKHGRGVAVEVERSKQLMYYGLGAMLVLGDKPVEEVVLTIVQPRCYHPAGPVRSWSCDALTMLDFAAQLAEDAERTKLADAPLNPGEHCRFCKAQAICPALQSRALETVQNSFTNVEHFDPERLAYCLEKIPEIKAWCESVHSFAHRQAELGNLPPGWKLVDKRAVRRWIPDVTRAFEHGTLGPIAGMLNVKESDLLAAPQLKTPAQAELIRGVNKNALEELVVRVSSGQTLVPERDDRPKAAGRIEGMFQVEGE